MTTIAELNYQRKISGLPLMRFDLRQLQPEDVQDLRDAYAALYEISDIAVGDSRGYTAIARGHGFDQDLCHNDSRIFLTWHRSYIYAFEKSLNSAFQAKRGTTELELTLPYWDWTLFNGATDNPNGIPTIVNDATYTDSNGNSADNPLAKARSLYRTTSQGLTGNNEFTHRYTTQLSSAIPLLKTEVETYLDNPDFMSFSNDLNGGAHGTIHVVVGGSDGSSSLPGNIGDMRSVVSAGYDPIFWLHHSMVDKVWFDWQTLNPNATVPTNVLNTPVYDGLPGSTYIDAENSLRYIYTSDSVAAAVASTGTVDTSGEVIEDENDDTNNAPPSPKPNKEVYLGSITGPFVRAQLDFLQLRPPKNSYEIRAYINNPKCDARTSYNDASYSGRLVLFGHGECHGAPGHCNPDLVKRDAYDIRKKHHSRYQKTIFSMDMTRGLRRHLGGKASAEDVTIYLVTVDGDGNAVATNSVRYLGCSLRTFG